MSVPAGAVHAFLAGLGHDGAGRSLAEVAAFDDARIESTHDFVQWCFPLAEPSAAVPGSPVLGIAESHAIAADEAARAGLRTMLERMTRFYGATTGWLRPHDHNHLRITRILRAVGALLGPAEAERFHARVLVLDDAAGNPVSARSRSFWADALETVRRDRSAV